MRTGLPSSLVDRKSDLSQSLFINDDRRAPSFGLRRLPVPTNSPIDFVVGRTSTGRLHLATLLASIDNTRSGVDNIGPQQ